MRRAGGHGTCKCFRRKASVNFSSLPLSVWFLLGPAVGSSGLNGNGGAEVKPSVTVAQHTRARTHTVPCVCVCAGRGCALEKGSVQTQVVSHYFFFQLIK